VYLFFCCRYAKRSRATSLCCSCSSLLRALLPLLSKKPLPLLLKLLLLLLHLLDALVLLCVAVDDEAVVEESVIIIFYFYEKWIFVLSLSFILSFLLKMVEEEGRKILSSLSLFLFSTQQARARKETRSDGTKLWKEDRRRV